LDFVRVNKEICKQREAAYISNVLLSLFLLSV